MAGISETISLVDGSSAVMIRIANAADGMTVSIEKAKGAMEAMEGASSGASSALGSAKSAFSGMLSTFTMGNIAANIAMRIADAVAQIPGKLMEAADAYSGMQARLQMVSGSAERTAQMNDMIFQSALRARGSYDGMLDSVSKIAMTAKEAFPDARTVVPFVEEIQKLFAIGGTGVQQQKDAMLQLTQALGSGKLQGDEFRSIAEAAPLIEQMVAKEMGVTQGQLKKLSSQGVITADVLRDAILHNAKEINAQFESMPMTWGAMMQNMGSIAERAMVPVYTAVQRIANSSALQSVFNGLASAITIFGSVAGAYLNYIVSWWGELIDGVRILYSWSVGLRTAFLEVFGPTLFGLFEVYLAYLGLIAGAWVAANAEEMLGIAIDAAKAAGTAVLKTVTGEWRIVTLGAAAAQALLNAVMMANPLGVIIALVLVVIGVFAAWKIHTVGLRNAIAEAFESMGRIVQSCVDGMIGSINFLIRGLNTAATKINEVFGTNIQQTAEISYTQGDWGKEWSDGVKNFSLDSLVPKVSTPAMPNIGGASAGAGTVGDIAKNGKATAANTGKMAQAMDFAGDDLRLLRELAERKAIDKYTTASVTIDLGGVTNQISNDMDIDGVVDKLTAGLRDGMVNAAQEVHV
ncbi:tape measure protein [Allisonella histaminiformans]|uniref:tape measure protein n=1 Tax=Allisonella histaminiformans TaxID=209880 RepID=UPI002E77F7AD|nr:tape measure protein [Allisonella histaminiformans]